MLILGEKLMNYVTPIESKKHKGFFVVPITDLILVSKEGKFINTLTGQIKRFSNFEQCSNFLILVLKGCTAI